MWRFSLSARLAYAYLGLQKRPKETCTELKTFVLIASDMLSRANHVVAKRFVWVFKNFLMELWKE